MLISDVASSCTQQPSVSSTGWGRVIPVGRAIAFPQADVTWRGVLCLRKMVSAVWGMTQHRDAGGCSFSSLPRATNPSLSSSMSSPLCPPSAAPQSIWLQVKYFFLHWLFKRLSDSPEICPWQIEMLLLFTGGCFLSSFSALLL